MNYTTIHELKSLKLSYGDDNQSTLLVSYKCQCKKQCNCIWNETNYHDENSPVCDIYTAVIGDCYDFIRLVFHSYHTTSIRRDRITGVVEIYRLMNYILLEREDIVFINNGFIKRFQEDLDNVITHIFEEMKRPSRGNYDMLMYNLDLCSDIMYNQCKTYRCTGCTLKNTPCKNHIKTVHSYAAFKPLCKQHLDRFKRVNKKLKFFIPEISTIVMKYLYF